MKAVIRTWGNSLAVRIPKAFAVHMGFDDGKEVELSLTDDTLHIQATPPNLHMLLDKITPENLHEEIQTGPAVGNEIW